MRDTRGPAPRDARIAARRVVEPSRLSEPDRAALANRLYAVNRRIFSGVSAEEFRRQVVDRPADATMIQIYEAADGRLIGYCGLHLYRRRVLGRNAVILRAEAGLLPEYRGRGVTYGFGIRRALGQKLRHPFTPVFFFGTLVHASSYHLFCKYFPLVYPHPGYDTPAHMKEVARTLADSFPAPAVTPDDPFVRNDGWVTIESPQEKALNRRRDRADVQFYKARNPGYARGHGLVVVMPITFSNLLAGLLARLRERLLIAIARHRPEL